MIDFAALPHFMVPRFFAVAGAFPKTAFAKVQKHPLRERGSHAAWDRAANGLDITRHGVKQLTGAEHPSL